MMFAVSLIRAPADLDERQLAELELNCRHVEGRWCIFEGDEDALTTPISVWSEGVTTGLHEDDVATGQPIIDLAVEIFGLTGWPPTRSMRFQSSTERHVW